MVQCSAQSFLVNQTWFSESKFELKIETMDYNNITFKQINISRNRETSNEILFLYNQIANNLAYEYSKFNFHANFLSLLKIQNQWLTIRNI